MCIYPHVSGHVSAQVTYLATLKSSSSSCKIRIRGALGNHPNVSLGIQSPWQMDEQGVYNHLHNEKVL